MRETRRGPGTPGTSPGTDQATDLTGTGTSRVGPPALDPAVERSRRRFARRQWARRWLAWRYVVAAGLVLVLVVGGLWLVFFSSTLAVEQVQVQGEQTLSEDDVRAAAAVPLGEPLARVDLTAIRARVQALAVVRSATVTRHWPDGVTITVVERRPVAVVDVSGQIRGMDADGVLFRDYQRPPADLPLVETSSETRADALREAAAVVTALPDDLAARVDHVDVVTVDQISLVLRDGRTVDWGSAEQSDLKAEVLVPLLERERQADRYDVSVPGLPTFE